MTKKDFIALADMIRAHNSLAGMGNTVSASSRFTEAQIEKLADFCAAQNPNFDRDRWLAYIAGDCGANGGKIACKTAPKAISDHVTNWNG